MIQDNFSAEYVRLSFGGIVKVEITNDTIDYLVSIFIPSSPNSAKPKMF